MNLRSHCAFAVLFLSLVSLGVERADAFDVVDRQASYLDSKFVTLGVGLGFTDFARQSGIRGDRGFGFRVTAGHHFNRYLSAEIGYQFSTFSFDSPDPVAPATTINTGAAMNQETIRLVATWPALIAQPFVSVGFGGYNLIGVNPETALSFPMDIQLPVGAGVRSYVYKNLISFDAEFNYQFLFGENQDPGTLALLGINKVSFDTYSVMMSFTFHIL